jgi:photosystem II stability/assembly factor-like uncharacterized protein
MNELSLTNRNPPGLSALAYRVSNYTTAKQRILESLYVPLIPDRVTLAALKTRDRDDITIALIDAWAMVIDVLTFYQERIANEGFWCTATERRSLLELAREIGYELEPGVSASTYLVFTVETTPGAPSVVTVAEGTAIASIPGENEQSQIFETSESLTARADWNAFFPRLSRPQIITPKTNQLYLQGLDLKLQVGDRLLLIDQESSEYQYLLKLTAVDVLTDQQRTRISWEEQELGVGSPRNPRLFAFRQRAALFGNIAPKWETLPDEVKREYSAMRGGCFQLSEASQWTAISTGLPTIDIWCLTASENALFAGTSTRGIYRSLDHGASWQASTIGLSNLAITALYYNSGSVFAGSPAGGVFRSKDNGETWTTIGTGNIRVQPAGTTQIEMINTGIPNTVVRAILACTATSIVEAIARVESSSNESIIHSNQTRFRSELAISDTITIADHSYTITAIPSDTTLKVTPQITTESPTSFTIPERNFLFVGTDNGIYRSFDQGQNWYPRGLKTASIRALLTIGTTTQSIYAGTEQGIFRSRDYGNQWEPKNQNLPQSITSLATITLNGIIYIFAGTKGEGVYRLQDETESWQQTTLTQAITALAVHETTLFAATPGGKVFATQDTGYSWIELDPTAIATEVTALTIFQNALVAGTRFAGFTETDWPRTGQSLTAASMSESHQFIDLDAVYPQLLPNSWLVCLDQDQFQPVRAESIRTAIARGFTLESPVSRVSLRTPTALDRFRPQTTIVLAQNELLPLANLPLSLNYNDRSILEQFQDPIGNDAIFLDQFVPGLQPGQNVVITGKRPRVQINQVGGLFRCNQPNAPWQRDNQGLTNLNVLSLTTTTKGNYFAGTEQGLFQRSNQKRWDLIDTAHQPDSGISPNLAIQLLYTVPAQNDNPETLFAGTETGVLRSRDQGRTWEAIPTLTQIRAITHSNTNGYLFVATENSIFRSTNNGGTWTAIDRDLLAVQVQALAVDREGVLFAGTSTLGIFRSQDDGESWEWVGYSGRSGTGAIVSTDTIVSGVGTLFSEQLKPGDLLIAMGQTRTIVQLDEEHPNTRLTIDVPFDPPGLPEGTPFTLSTGLENLNVTALAIDEQPGLIEDQQPGTETMIFAGTAGGGIFRSSDLGNHWESVNQTLESFDITTLIAYAHPGVDQLELYGTTIRLVPNSSESINLRKGSSITINNETRIITTEPRIITTEPQDQKIAEFTINVAFSSPEDAESKPYTIPTLVAGTTSSGLFYSIDRGENWIGDRTGLTNTSIRAILPPCKSQDDCLVGGVGILLSSDQRSYTSIRPGNSLQVLSRPISDPITGTIKWHLLDANQFSGVLVTTTPEDFSIQPANTDDGTISELARLLTSPINQQNPLLVFQNALNHCYDPGTVTIHANVIAATHGETIADRIEILGSGDGNLANQTFVLKKPPLTYVPQEGVVSNTLQVRVNDLLWREVPALYNLKPDDQVYIVRTTDDGTTYITFGDGITGARLPSGVDNVVATYRSGMGLNGNIAANKLSLLKTRSLGIQSVTNPLPATGAADPETRDQIRDRAPLTIRTLDRIISVRDVEDFAYTFPGIRKAQAVSLWSAQTKVIHLTIAGSEGVEIPDDSVLYQSLVQAIEQRRDPYQSPPIIASYQRIEFNLEATVLIDARYLPDHFKTTIESKLQETFAFVDRAFGQNVTAAEIIALIQSVSGVIAVDLDALYLVDRPKTLEQCLIASPASWNPDAQFTAAQLLLMHTAKLTVQSIVSLP